MAKTSNIQEKFGVVVTLLNEVEPAILSEMEANLREQLANKGVTLPANAHVYVTQLGINALDRHFKVAGIEQRLSYLQVTASLSPAAFQSGRISIYDLGVESDSQIPVRRHTKGLAYRLPGDYIAKHDRYTDHIAVTVQPNCSRKHRRLEVQITAQATPDYAGRLRNVPNGRVISRLNFELAQSLQLTLAL